MESHSAIIMYFIYCEIMSINYVGNTRNKKTQKDSRPLAHPGTPDGLGQQFLEPPCHLAGGQQR